jgi:DNA-binding MarR family transcriptional regulator
MHLSSTAVSGFVTRVERHGLVERQHRSDDRRIVECVLTEAGSQFLDELTGMRLDALRSALAALTPRELSGFRVLLARIGERQGEPA